MQAAAVVKVPEKQSVRVERPFYFNGKPTQVGQVIELPSIFAREMIAAKKAAALAAKAQESAMVDNKPVAGDKATLAKREGGANAR